MELMTSLLCPVLRRALWLVAVKSGEQLLVGSSKSPKQGRPSFRLSGAGRGWQLCCRTAASMAERQVLAERARHACPRYSRQEDWHGEYCTCWTR